MEDFRLKIPTGGVSGGYGRNRPYSILKLIMTLPQGMDDTIPSVFVVHSHHSSENFEPSSTLAVL